jgi:tRNA A37 threonylcarbamoyltransferase TsaD
MTNLTKFENKIVHIEKSRKEKESEIEASVQLLRKDFNGVLFEFQNMNDSFSGLKGSVSTLKEQFKKLELKYIQELGELNKEISK